MKSQQFYKRLKVFLERQNPRDTEERDLLLEYCNDKIEVEVKKLDTNYHVNYNDKYVSVPHNIELTQEEANYFRREGYSIQKSL